jgi:opacity protein-like surface antigen
MKKIALAALLLMISTCAFAQQDYVGRYDVYAGYSYLGSPKINLSQRGLNIQLGYNWNRWLAFGFDYSNQDGRGTLVPNELKQPYFGEVDGLVLEGEAGLLTEYGVPTLPANYDAYVPFAARTQTFAAGPQLVFRNLPYLKRKKIGLFLHPSLGAIHEHINLEPHDIFTGFVMEELVAGGVLQTTHPSDTTYFYGFGGGIEFNATKHVHLRTDVEFVHVNLFSGLLADSRNSVRVSVGPTFNFGKNVKK